MFESAYEEGLRHAAEKGLSGGAKHEHAYNYAKRSQKVVEEERGRCEAILNDPMVKNHATYARYLAFRTDLPPTIARNELKKAVEALDSDGGGQNQIRSILAKTGLLCDH